MFLASDQQAVESEADSFSAVDGTSPLPSINEAPLHVQDGYPVSKQILVAQVIKMSFQNPINVTYGDKTYTIDEIRKLLLHWFRRDLDSSLDDMEGPRQAKQKLFRASVRSVSSSSETSNGSDRPSRPLPVTCYPIFSITPYI